MWPYVTDNTYSLPSLVCSSKPPPVTPFNKELNNTLKGQTHSPVLGCCVPLTLIQPLHYYCKNNIPQLLKPLSHHLLKLPLLPYSSFKGLKYVVSLALEVKTLLPIFLHKGPIHILYFIGWCPKNSTFSRTGSGIKPLFNSRKKVTDNASSLWSLVCSSDPSPVTPSAKSSPQEGVGPMLHNIVTGCSTVSSLLVSLVLRRNDQRVE